MQDAPGPLTILAQAYIAIRQAAEASRIKAEARDAARRARRQTESNERIQREQRRQWFEQVQRQNVRGHAGNATQEEARAALRGRGGRPNPLDDRWF
jgi:hypothetical protein